MTDLVAVLEEAVREDRKDFGTPTSWRFSSLGKCLRAQVLGRLGVEGAPFQDNTLSLFRIGDLIEDDTLKLLGKKIVVVTRDVNGRQVRATMPEYDASGSLDALIVLDGVMGPLDVKSTRDSALSYGDLPYQTHAKQVAAYALALGFLHGWLLYLGRDGAKKWFKVRAADYEQDIKKEWAELNFWWKQAWDSVPEDGYAEVGLPPKKPQVQATKKVKGVKVPFTYERDGPWGRTGDPKMELDNECTRCPYIERCWGSNELGSPEGDANNASGGAENQKGDTPDRETAIGAGVFRP